MNDYDERFVRMEKQIQNKQPDMNGILPEDNNDMDQKKQKLKLWLKDKVGLPQYFDIFLKNGIDELSTAVLLDKITLKEIGIDKIGHQMRILNELKQIR